MMQKFRGPGKGETGLGWKGWESCREEDCLCDSVPSAFGMFSLPLAGSFWGTSDQISLPHDHTSWCPHFLPPHPHFLHLTLK